MQVYFPIEMHIIDKQVPRWGKKWTLLQCLSMLCLLVTLGAGIGSIAFIVESLKVIHKAYPGTPAILTPTSRRRAMSTVSIPAAQTSKSSAQISIVSDTAPT